MKKSIAFVCMCVCMMLCIAARATPAFADSVFDEDEYNGRAGAIEERVQALYKEGKLFPSDAQPELIYATEDKDGSKVMLQHIYAPDMVAAVIDADWGGEHYSFIRKFKCRDFKNIVEGIETGMTLAEVKKYLQDDSLKLNEGYLDLDLSDEMVMTMHFTNDIFDELSFYFITEGDIDIDLKMGEDRFDYRDAPSVSPTKLASKAVDVLMSTDISVDLSSLVPLLAAAAVVCCVVLIVLIVLVIKTSRR